MTGHWEMMGIKTEKPFRTFTEHGFPAELDQRSWRNSVGKKVIGNKSASGTEIIEELGRGRDSYRIYDRVYVGGFGYADLRK